MTAKSIIQVDIDPEGNFKAFYEQYQEYQAHLESAPEEWRRTGEAIDDANDPLGIFAEQSEASKDFLLIAATQAEIISKEIRKASASNVAMLEGLSKNTQAQKAFADEAARSEKHMKALKKGAHEFASEIFGLGKFLLKLGALGGGLAGLGGLLSGIGLKDLAGSAVDTQRSARGLGMTPGQLTAFDQDFGMRYLDRGTLGSVADAQSSFQGRMWLARAAGETMDQVAGEDPGQLAGQLALRAHDWWVNTPENMRTAEVLQSTGFTQAGFSLNLMKQLGNTPRGELEDANSKYGADQGRFNVSNGNTNAWYGFLRQIKDAGNFIETHLTNKLASLSGPLQHFVDVIGKDAMKLIDDIFTPQNLKSLEDGIDGFATYLGSPRFQRDMKDFAALVAYAAEKMRSVAKFLGIDVGSSTGPSGSLDPNEVQRETHGQVTGFTAESNGVAAKYQALSPTFTDKLAGSVQKMSGEPGYFGDFEKSQNLPEGLLYTQEIRESRGNIGALSPKGAMGPFQFMPDTANEFGLEDPYNLHDSAAAAARKMGGLVRYYKGDVKKAIAAYNWGEGHLDKDIAANGANWQSGLPPETRKYLGDIVAALSRRNPNAFKVVIQNDTSARVATQANAAAAQ